MAEMSLAELTGNLERCIAGESCAGCVFESNGDDFCIDALMQAALRVIKAQRAQLERAMADLKHKDDCDICCYSDDGSIKEVLS